MTINPCVIIPVYNHADRLAGFLEDIKSHNLSVILINDGCDSWHRQQLVVLAQERDWVSVIHHDQNQGKGAAVITGLRAAHQTGFSHALQIDADGQHDVADVPKLLALAIDNEGALIAGQPVYDDSVPRLRYLGRYLTHVWVWIETLSFDIKDSMCGFRVYPLEQTIPILDKARLGQHMDFDTEVLVRHHWQGVHILSVPTKVIYPEDGVSHFRMLADNILITRMHTRLFFGMLWRFPILVVRKLKSRRRLVNCANEY